MTKQSNTANRLEFPHDGKVRAKQIAEFLAIGVSTWWLYVKQGRVDQPQRYGKRVSVWNASYVRDLANNGIPSAYEQQKTERSARKGRMLSAEAVQ